MGGNGVEAPVPRRASAAAEGAAQRGKCLILPPIDSARRLYQLLLGGDQQIALGIQHFQEGGGAVVVAQLARRAFVCASRLALWIVNCSASQCFSAQRIGHPAEGRIEWFFVSGDGDVAAAPRQLQIGAAAPAIGRWAATGAGMKVQARPPESVKPLRSWPCRSRWSAQCAARTLRGPRRCGYCWHAIGVHGEMDVRATDQQRPKAGPACPQNHVPLPSKGASGGQRAGSAYQQCQGSCVARVCPAAPQRLEFGLQGLGEIQPEVEPKATLEMR